MQSLLLIEVVKLKLAVLPAHAGKARGEVRPAVRHQLGGPTSARSLKTKQTKQEGTVDAQTGRGTQLLSSSPRPT